MENALSPTKGNLISARRSLQLARLGYELMDRKRNILIHELMEYVEEARRLRVEIDKTFSSAYASLQQANISLGLDTVQDISTAVEQDNGIRLMFRSIMGVELPIVDYSERQFRMHYGFVNSNSMLDNAYLNFELVKKMIIKLARIDSNIYLLAIAIKKTQKRANALKNVIIPRFEGIIKYITEYLEEKDREDFTRLKVIKRSKPA